LGACIGEGIAGKQLGKKAMFLGAIAQSIPDIDFVSSFWLGPAENLLAHRGFTHSILFAFFITGLMTVIAKQRKIHQKISIQKWVLFFGVNVFTHLIIDAFNAYGTGWFEPFSHVRISFHTLFVVDPLFTIWPLACSIILLLLAKKHPKRKFWWRAGVGLSVLYLFFALVNKVYVQTDVKHILSQQHIQNKKFFISPTPLNSLLWYVVVQDSAGFHIGYRSVFDTKERMELNYFARNDYLLHNVDDHESLQHLRRFSQGYYTVEQWHDTLVFNDLRFGQMVGWYQPNGKFVFHYFLRHPEENQLVVQRGRFAKWDEAAIHSLFIRIKGN
jgi:inner membrane protein